MATNTKFLLKQQPTAGVPDQGLKRNTLKSFMKAPSFSRLFCLTAVLLVAVLAGCQFFPSYDPVEVTVTVLDGASQPVAGADVTLEGPQNFAEQTDASGIVVFPRVAPDNYILKASYPDGYEANLTLHLWGGENYAFTFQQALAAPESVWAVSTDQDVWLFWEASLGATSYVVLRGTSTDEDAEFEEVAVVGSTSYVDVAADATYYYKVEAINATGERSDPSATVSGSNDLLPGDLGVAFPDISGNGNHAYIGGNPRWITLDGGGHAVEFDNASNEYLHTLTRGHLDGATDVVMEMEIYYEADLWTGRWGIVGGPHVGSGSTSAGNVQFTWTRRDPDGIDFRFHVEGDTNEQRLSTVIPAGEFDNSWVILRAEFDNGQYALFANDILMRDGNRGARLNTLNLPFYVSSQSSNYGVGERTFKGQVKYVKLQVDGEVVLEWDFATLIQP